MYAVVPYSGRIWPNGEFGISRQREVPFSFKGQSHKESHQSHWDKSLIAVHGIESVIEYKRLERGYCYLGSSLLTKSRTRKARGLKGISRFGSKMVRNAAKILEDENSRNKLTFLTLTLPGLSDVGLKVVAKNWSAIVKSFTERLKRHLIRSRLPGEILSVTEVQEKRLHRTGEAALHLHAIFRGTNSDRGGWAVTPALARMYWKDSVVKFVQEDVCWDSCENLQRVKKSAAGYLGKYMTKGVRSAASEEGLAACPSAWWNCSQSLRLRVKKGIICNRHVISMLAEMCEANISGTFVVIREVLIKIREDFFYPAGWYGKISDEILQILGQEYTRRVHA